MEKQERPTSELDSEIPGSHLIPIERKGLCPIKDGKIHEFSIQVTLNRGFRGITKTIQSLQDLEIVDGLVSRSEDRPDFTPIKSKKELLHSSLP